MGLIRESFTYLVPGGQALKLIKNGANITNSTNPLNLTKNIPLTIIDCCSPAPIRLAAHCFAATTYIVIAVVRPNLLTIGSAIHLANEIYEQC